MEKKESKIRKSDMSRIAPYYEEDDSMEVFQVMPDIEKVVIDIDEIPHLMEILLSDNVNEKISVLPSLSRIFNKFSKGISEFYGIEHFHAISNLLGIPEVVPYCLVCMSSITKVHPDFPLIPEFFNILLNIISHNLDDSFILENILIIAGNLFIFKSNIELAIECNFIHYIVSINSETLDYNFRMFYKLKLWMISQCLYSETRIGNDLLEYLIQLTPNGYDHADAYILTSFSHAVKWSKNAKIIILNSHLLQFAFELIHSPSKGRIQALEFIKCCVNNNIPINPKQLFLSILDQFAKEDDTKKVSIDFQRLALQIFQYTLNNATLDIPIAFTEAFINIGCKKILTGKDNNIMVLTFQLLEEFSQKYPILLIELFDNEMSNIIIELIDSGNNPIVKSVTIIFGSIIKFVQTIPEKKELLTNILTESLFFDIIDKIIVESDLNESDSLVLFVHFLHDFID